MKNFKVGIIGCGSIFSRHAYSVKDEKMAELVAVCDIKEDRARLAAESFGCDYYTDYKEMIDKAGVDVVHVCTPHYLHPEMVIYALNAKADVLTEKPMSIKIEDAREMVKAAKDNGKTLGVIFQNRYNAGSQLVKRVLSSGELGSILSAKLSVTWCRTDEYYSKSDWKGTWDKEGGGVVIDQSIHTMDLLRWFVDSEIDYVDASISNRAHEIIEVEDSAEGVIKYKNGVITGFYVMNYYTYDAPVEIEIHCERGTAKIEAVKATIKFNDGRVMIADADPNENFPFIGGKSYWGVSHLKQIANFYEALSKGVKPDITGEEALKTQEMICAIYKSGKEKIRVKF